MNLARLSGSGGGLEKGKQALWRINNSGRSVVCGEEGF